jgi:hypothetical protein
MALLTTAVLYLRHRIQKGFLSRDSPPEPDSMPDMHRHLTALEDYQAIEARIISIRRLNGRESRH